MGRQSTSNLFLTLAALSIITPSLGQNWVLTEGNALTISRLDPIVNPGGVATHVHNVIGGSKFSQDAGNPGDLLSSKCSSTQIQADKSNYWAPQVYYRYPDNTYAPMPGNARIYYFKTADDVKPFPPGLKMISGLSMSRNETDPRAFGVKIACNHGSQGARLPTKESAPGGCSMLTTGIYFPSCGKADGSLDSEDHYSHMAWPYNNLGPNKVDYQTGINCPPSHPIHYPVIFMEINYWFSGDQPWRDEDDLIVLSNGDTTGLAYHADFHNGWDQGVLTAAIAQCSVGDDVEKCAPFKPSLDVEAGRNCRLEGTVPSEDIGFYKSLPKLPGCNPLWTAKMSDTKPTCEKEYAQPGFVAPNSYYRNDWLRMNIPLTLLDALPSKLTSWYRPHEYQGMDIKVSPGSSHIVEWGSEDTAKYVKVSTVDQILQSFVQDDGTRSSGGNGSGIVTSPDPTAINGGGADEMGNTKSSSTTASSSTTTKAVEVATTSPAAAAVKAPATTDKPPANLVAVPTTSSSSSATVTVTAPAETVTIVDKTCRRNPNKIRRVAKRAANVGDSLRNHISRRSRRQAIKG